MKMTPFLEYIVYDIFTHTGPVTFRPMMGGYVLYYEGNVFALVEDEELFFKGSKEMSSWYLERGSKRFSYTKEGKDAYLYYYLVPPEVYEDRSRLLEWMDVALSVAEEKRRK